MELLTGEINVTLDDKGRLSLPSRFRSLLTDNVLVLTKGLERCIWVFPPAHWELVSERLMASASLNLEKSSWVQHRFIVPSQQEEIDRAGRIAIPPSLRNYALLNRECVICGVIKYIEIWAADQYEAYKEINEPKSKTIMEELGPLSLL
jgi:MraZ protein